MQHKVLLTNKKEGNQDKRRGDVLKTYLKESIVAAVVLIN